MNESWSGAGHLWAIGYADVDPARQVKEEIIRLGWNEPYLFLSDVAVVVGHADGPFRLNREPFPTGANILGSTTVGFIAMRFTAAAPIRPSSLQRSGVPVRVAWITFARSTSTATPRERAVAAT